jgi:hypothetical protein
VLGVTVWRRLLGVCDRTVNRPAFGGGWVVASVARVGGVGDTVVAGSGFEEFFDGDGLVAAGAEAAGAESAHEAAAFAALLAE